MLVNAVRKSEYPVLTGDNHVMTWVASSPARMSAVRQILRAPFSRRAWAELGYAIISFPLAVAGFFVAAVPFAHVMLVFVSTPIVREFGSVNRRVLHRLLGERVPPPPPMRVEPYLKVQTRDGARLAGLVATAGGKVEQKNREKLKITGMTAPGLSDLAAREQVAIEELKPRSGWLEAAIRDVPGWRARAYLVLKLPVAGGMLVAGLGCWLAGLWPRRSGRMALACQCRSESCSSRPEWPCCSPLRGLPTPPHPPIGL